MQGCTLCSWCQVSDERQIKQFHPRTKYSAVAFYANQKQCDIKTVIKSLSLSMRNVWRNVNPKLKKIKRVRIQRLLTVRVLHLLCLQCRRNMTILFIFSNSLPNNSWKCHEINFYSLFIYLFIYLFILCFKVCLKARSATVVADSCAPKTHPPVRLFL